MYRAFQGPNGWYVAWECARDAHSQPANGGHMTQRQAADQAEWRNDEHEADRREQDRIEADDVVPFGQVEIEW